MLIAKVAKLNIRYEYIQYDGKEYVEVMYLFEGDYITKEDDGLEKFRDENMLVLSLGSSRDENIILFDVMLIFNFT